MSYILNWSDPNFKVPSSISLNPLSTNSTSLSISLFGKAAPNYGQGQQQSFIRLLENFCSDTEPSYSTIGQLWYDRGVNQLKILQYDGVGGTGQLLSSWKVVGGATVAPVAPTGSKIGDLWYNTGTIPVGDSPLNYFNGVSWMSIADSTVLTAHALDTSLHLTTEQNTLLDNIGAIISSNELIALNNITGNVQDQLNALTASSSSSLLALQEEADTRTSNDNAIVTALAAEVTNRTANDTANYNDLLSRINLKVAKAGDTMSGYLTLINTNPTDTWHAVPKQYLDTSIFNAFAAMSNSGAVLYQREYETTVSAATSAFTVPTAASTFGSYGIGTNDLFVFISGTKQIRAVNYTEDSTLSIQTSVPLNTSTTVTFEKFLLGGGLNVPSTAAISSIKQVNYTASANQTVFNVPSGFTNVIGSNTLFVWVNGVKQIANLGTSYSYTETNGTQITFNSALPAGAVVELIGFNLVAPATIQRNVILTTTAGQTQYIISPSINPTSDGVWTFVSGVLQSKLRATVTSNGYAVILSSGASLGTFVEIYSFKIA